MRKTLNKIRDDRALMKLVEAVVLNAFETAENPKRMGENPKRALESVLEFAERPHNYILQAYQEYFGIEESYVRAKLKRKTLEKMAEI